MAENEFIVGSHERDDPGRAQLRAALDKLKGYEGRDVLIVQQLPNDVSPTRFLVSGPEDIVRGLLSEFEPAVRIEPNRKINLF